MFFAALSPELARLVFALPASSPVLVSTLAGFASSNCLRVLRLTLHKIRFRIAGAQGFAYQASRIMSLLDLLPSEEAPQVEPDHEPFAAIMRVRRMPLSFGCRL